MMARSQTPILMIAHNHKILYWICGIGNHLDLPPLWQQNLLLTAKTLSQRTHTSTETDLDRRVCKIAEKGLGRRFCIGA